MDTVELIAMIKTTNARRGDGKLVPIRIITQYWDMDGNLVFEIDPLIEANRANKKKSKPQRDY